MSVDLTKLIYKPLSAECPRGAFSCHDRDIDKWFRKSALKQHDAFTVRVTTVHLPDIEKPVGFYSLRLDLENDRLLQGDGPVRRRVIEKLYPALHLEYLAVDKPFQGNGIGPDMLASALVKFREAVESIGVPVLTLCPLEEKLVKFYADRGFVPYAKHLNYRRMLLTAEMVMRLPAKPTPSAR